MGNQQYDNTNKGVLFVNDKERDSQPDYKGSININGEEFWLSAWIKTPKDRNKDDFLSLSVTPKDNNHQQTRSTNTNQRSDGRDFLDRNKSTIDKHRGDSANRAPHANDNLHQQDYDSFDDDIPF